MNADSGCGGRSCEHMTIPKEIREKVEQKLKLDEEIKDWIKENLDAEDMFF